MARFSRWLLIALLGFGAASQAELPREVKRALAARDYASAIAWLEPQAQAGDPEAAFELGKLYRLGKGVAADQEQAAEFFAVAAAAGNPNAQHLLAIYHESIGDQAEANRLMALAAAGGHRKAEDWLASQHTGIGKIPVVTRIRNGTPPAADDDYDFEEISLADDQGLTPLMIAVKQASAPWTSALLQAGVDVNAQDKLGNTALHYATSAENVGLTAALLAGNANPNIASRTDATPLHLAVAIGNSVIARSLLQAGADGSIPGEGGWSAAQIAARSTNTELLKLFDIRTAPAVSGPGGNSVKALALAVQDGDLQAIRRLTAAGVSVDETDANGITAINHAIHSDQLEALKILLSRSAESAAPSRAMLVAAAERSPATLAWLVDDTGNPDFTDAAGDSALIHAARSGCTRCVVKLLAAGADPDLRNRQGDTALLVASRTANIESAELLAQATSELDALDANHRSALWWASKAGLRKTCELLTQRGASPLADKDGLTPLHVAALENQSSVIPVLVDDTTIVSLTPSGNTALILAASKNSNEALQLLLEAGAELEHRNATGNTALIVATAADAYDAADALIAAGANPKLRNNQFESAKSIAEKRNDSRWQNLLAGASSPGLLGIFD